MGSRYRPGFSFRRVGRVLMRHHASRSMPGNKRQRYRPDCRENLNRDRMLFSYTGQWTRPETILFGTKGVAKQTFADQFFFLRPPHAHLKHRQKFRSNAPVCHRAHLWCSNANEWLPHLPRGCENLMRGFLRRQRRCRGAARFPRKP